MNFRFDNIKQMLDLADAIADQFDFISEELRPAYQAHILSILSGACMEVFGTRLERPDWVPYIPYYFPRAAPNPDTVYSFAPVDPHGTYLISGKRGNETLAAITLRKGGAHLGTRPGMRTGEIDFSSLETRADGQFSFILSQTRPAGYSGQWFHLDPETESLMLRRVTKDISETDSICCIERIDNVPQALAQPDNDYPAKLEKVCRYTLDQNLFLLRYMAHLKNIGADKEFVADDQAAHGGLIIQRHYFHLYALAEDEALILEARLPLQCKYWSLQLITSFASTPDYIMRQSALNDAQAIPDADGRIRIILSAKDPGVANWLDTGEWLSGGLQWRWNDFDADPRPTVTRVRIKDLFTYLPDSTLRMDPEARLKALSERARYYQQRRR